MSIPDYIYNIKELDLNKTYSSADYLLWRFKERVELFKGKVFEMSPAHSMSYQKTILKMTRFLDHFFEDHTCELFVAPFDVELFSRQDAKSNVVQPDLCIVCDQNKLDERGCHGPPDLVVEILSRGNAKKEIQNKYDLYQEAGVREYWIIDYMRRTVLFQVLNEKGLFQAQRIRAEGDHIASVIFPDLKCLMDDIFKGVTDSLNQPDQEYLSKHSRKIL